MALSPRASLAIAASRFLTFAIRLSGRGGGTSLPGKVALKICPTLLETLSDRFTILMVTGTNGKTTTSRMIARLLEASGIRYETNKSGANLASGVTATVAGATSVFGRPKATHLLLETDEAAFRIVAPRLKPKAVVATNFFRDQLDRYGELYSTLNAVREGLAGTPDTLLAFNADDSLCASLAIDMASGAPANRPLLSYGLAAACCSGTEPESSDAAYCIRCSTRYRYAASSYGHLGHFACPACGYSRPRPDVEGLCVDMADDRSRITYRSPRGDHAAEVALPGLYNVYNALSAAALAEALSLKPDAVRTALASFERGFGRMETFAVSGRTVQIILVKNPTGFNQVLQHLIGLSDPMVPFFLINDRLADGTDISWLWDVDFERFAVAAEAVPGMVVSGTRADDMAVRLKYAGVGESRILTNPRAEDAFAQALALTPTGGTLCLMPTYTALMDLRHLLSRKYGLKNFWS